MPNLQNKRTNAQLRRLLDSDDSFLSRGHQIIKIRRHQHKRPEWTKHENQIRGLILLAFPRCEDNDEAGKRQRVRAGRWARVIQLYYAMGYTYSQVAEEMGTTSNRVRNLIRHIVNVSRGKRANGSGFFTKKNKGDAIKTSFRETAYNDDDPTRLCVSSHVPRS